MRWLITLLSVLAVNHAYAAGFDCSKAASFTETAICADSNLSNFDFALSRVYQIALKRADKQELKTEQRTWLEKRDACELPNVLNDNDRKIKQKDCLKSLYELRLRELTKLAYFTKGMGVYRCHHLALESEAGVGFEVTNGVISNFSSATSYSSPDLNNGYSFTCKTGLGQFYDSKW